MTREQRAADKIMRKAGWEFVRMGKGSHRLYYHPRTGAYTCVSLRCNIVHARKHAEEASAA